MLDNWQWMGRCSHFGIDAGVMALKLHYAQNHDLILLRIVLIRFDLMRVTTVIGSTIPLLQDLRLPEEDGSSFKKENW